MVDGDPMRLLYLLCQSCGKVVHLVIQEVFTCSTQVHFSYLILLFGLGLFRGYGCSFEGFFLYFILRSLKDSVLSADL